MDEAIDGLLAGEYYREAWIVAKLHKEDEDMIFATISSKWITSLEQTGNLDGAALMYVFP